MKISTLHPDDIETIKPLWESLNEVHHKNSQNWKEHFAKFTFQKRIKSIQKNDKYSVFISSLNQEISGYCIASINNNIGEIDSIFVKESYRGTSLGKKLVEKAIEWLESKNVECIKVGIAEGNESVLQFYEKLGFKRSMTILRKI